VIHDLEKEVPEFVFERLIIVARDRVGNLVGFFDPCSVAWELQPWDSPRPLRIGRWLNSCFISV
jgi:hypothetical protein